MRIASRYHGAERTMSKRNDWLRLDDANLLRQCAVDTYRASGPGGQKRNKTSSAVRLRHHPSGLAVIAEERRSQHDNKVRALKRLRLTIALQIRERPAEASLALITRYRDAGGRLAVPRRSDDYWPVMALLLDVLNDSGGRLQRAAAAVGLTTSRLSAALLSHPKVMAAANRIRRDAGLKPLTRG